MSIVAGVVVLGFFGLIGWVIYLSTRYQPLTRFDPANILKALNDAAKPYPCPICHGVGKQPLLEVESKDTTAGRTSYSDQPCNACKGAGILWPPTVTEDSK